MREYPLFQKNEEDSCVLAVCVIVFIFVEIAGDIRVTS
jgi:hypothetical protein